MLAFQGDFYDGHGQRRISELFKHSLISDVAGDEDFEDIEEEEKEQEE